MQKRHQFGAHMLPEGETERRAWKCNWKFPGADHDCRIRSRQKRGCGVLPIRYRLAGHKQGQVRLNQFDEPVGFDEGAGKLRNEPGRFPQTAFGGPKQDLTLAAVHPQRGCGCNMPVAGDLDRFPGEWGKRVADRGQNGGFADAAAVAADENQHLEAFCWAALAPATARGRRIFPSM
jgi:hypothetical protein